MGKWLELVVVVEVVILLVSLRSHLHISHHLTLSNISLFLFLSLSHSLKSFSFLSFFLSLQRAATTGGLSSPAKTHQTISKILLLASDTTFLTLSLSLSLSCLSLFCLWVFGQMRSSSHLTSFFFPKEMVK